MIFKGTNRGMNRCYSCNHFKRWEELTLTRFVPDSPFGPEETEFTCIVCRKEK